MTTKTEPVYTTHNRWIKGYAFSHILEMSKDNITDIRKIVYSTSGICQFHDYLGYENNVSELQFNELNTLEELHELILSEQRKIQKEIISFVIYTTKHIHVFVYDYTSGNTYDSYIEMSIPTLETINKVIK